MWVISQVQLWVVEKGHVNSQSRTRLYTYAFAWRQVNHSVTLQLVPRIRTATLNPCFVVTIIQSRSIAISDSQFALSSSWDHALCHWDLKNGLTTGRFVDHTSDVLSEILTADNRHCLVHATGPLEHPRRVGECKDEIGDGHTEKYVYSLLT